MKVTKRQIRNFENIIKDYSRKTTYPQRDAWKDKSNNELWLWLVAQVMVVGGVAGNARFQSRSDLKRKMAFRKLKSFKGEASLRRHINAVLREAGIRYASSDWRKCHKSKALAHNYKFICEFKGGFKGLLRTLTLIDGRDAEHQRVAFIVEHFKYVKNKSARDFLMSMGINFKTLALDIRIQNIFKHYGIEFPNQNSLARKSVYDKTEKEIIEKICTPLNIKPVKFDRILFQNYERILLR